MPTGSLADITSVAERPTSAGQVNRIFEEEAGSNCYKGILGLVKEPIVSADIIKDPRASVVDLTMTQVICGDLIKVLSCYDNEWGYASQMVKEAVQMTAH